MNATLMVLALSAFPTATVLADTWEVPPGAEIQSYIDGAASGDTIMLAEGTYQISTTLTNDNKTLVIRGAGNTRTFLDGGGLNRIMTVTGTVELVELQVTNGLSEEGGGLLVGTGAALGMYECTVSDCIATRAQSGGGAVRTATDSSFYAANCIFRDNTSTGPGGAIFFDIMMPGRSYALANCDLRDNHSDNDGGGIFALSRLNFVDSCILEGNTAIYRAGGLYLGEGDVYNSIFSGNSAVTGGAVYCDINTAELEGGEFTGCTFTGNQSVEHGGAIYALGKFADDWHFTGCTFRDNISGARGGGLRVYADTGSVQSCVFESNVADEGGGMHLYAFGNTVYTIENSTFIGNSSAKGGGFGMSNSVVQLTGCQIRENDATELGGGIWTSETDCNDISITGGTLCGNTIGGETDGTVNANFHPCYSFSLLDPPCVTEICDSDTDGDGIIDCDDLCPTDPEKSDPGVCGCGVPELDLDGDGIIDCKPVYNRTKDTLHDSLREAVPSIDSGDEIAMAGAAVAGDSGPLFINDQSVTFQLQDDVVIPDGMLLRTGADTLFANEAADSSLAVAGQLVAPNADTISFQSLEVLADGQFLQNESLILVNETCRTSGSGRMFLNGEILAGLVTTTEAGENRIAGDTNVFSDYDNDGATIVQRGTLYIYGDLVNTGSLSGDVNNGLNGSEAPQPGDGFSIAGDYTVGSDAALVMPDPVWWLRVGGDLDIGIDEPGRFVMAEATIELTGLSPDPGQTLEAMSEDRGAVASGLDPDNYPIGSIRLRPGATVEVVNQHDNASGPGCEVIYADELVVPTGASLVTSGCPIYVRSASIDGSVSNPDDIVIIGDEPACPTDVNGDGTVDGVDLARVLGAWGTGNAAEDIDGDGVVSGSDLALILGDWGSSCSD